MQNLSNIELLNRRTPLSTSDMVHKYHRKGPIGHIMNKIPKEYKGDVGWTSKKNNYSGNGRIVYHSSPQKMTMELDYKDDFDVLPQFK